MADFFNVGEIAILQNCDLYPEWNGREVMVIGDMKPRLIHVGDGIVHLTPCYVIDIQNEHRMWAAAEPHQLRKRKPPQADTGETRIREMFDRPPVVQPELEPA